MTVLALALSVVGITLTPQQQAALAPIASTLVESISHDKTAIETGETKPDDPYIEPELEPPITTETEQGDGDEGSPLVKRVKAVVIEEATKSFFEHLLNW